jgi:hypothetical protein
MAKKIGDWPKIGGWLRISLEIGACHRFSPDFHKFAA